MNSFSIFESILQGQIPCDKVYEDDHTLAFHDIDPQAPVHILIIPKQKIINVSLASDDDVDVLGRLLLAARNIGRQLNLDQNGYRLVFNTGAGAGQTVFYLHCHFLAGRAFDWPPG